MKAQTASTTPPWYSERPASTGKIELIGLFRTLRYGSSVLCCVSLLLSAAMAQGQEQREAASSSPFTRLSLDAISGKALFEKLWVAAPSSTAASDGLGPYYNGRSCAACHPRGGQGVPSLALTAVSADLPQANSFQTDTAQADTRQSAPLTAALVLHLPSANDIVDFGHQLQPLAVTGLAAEIAVPRVRYRQAIVWLPGDEQVSLQVPEYQVEFPAKQQWVSQLSPRLAPDLRGVSLLDKIPWSALEAHADPTDADGDGISGRLGQDEGGAPTRFGWRAQARDLEDQVARALFLDMGLSSPHYPFAYGDCSPLQSACRQRAGTDDVPEVSQTVIDLLQAWLASLTPAPALPLNDSRQHGQRLFDELGCAKCHTPSYRINLADEPVIIHPYSDLLLHDMGERLADRDQEGNPLPSEWRTAPLWGLSDRQFLLHDGRAGNPQEAILWHDGEAAKARQAYQTLSAEQRARLLDFLNGL